MKKPVVIVGGGVVGVSMLFELASRGVEAVLLEAHDGLALETSYANGAMLTPSMPDPWNSPGVWRHLAASLFDPHSAMKLRLKAAPGLTFWGLKFLQHSTPSHHQYATDAAFRLAAYSTANTEELAQVVDLDFDFSTKGTLKIFESAQVFSEALAGVNRLEAHGLRFKELSGDEATEVEPLLAPVKGRIAGALYFMGDRSGDARLFTEALAAAAVQSGAVVKKNVRVEKILTEQGAIIGVETSAGKIDTDRIILCAGNASPTLARQAGVELSIKPVKGYSVTFKLAAGVKGPSLPVIDDAMHAAVTPIGDRVRAAGTAEFTGFDRRLSPERVENLLNLFGRLYPGLADKIDPSTKQPWTNFRPMSADGLPFIGAAGPSGLYVNTGHGHLGWTMATGSAKMLADLMEEKRPAIDPSPYQVKR